MPETEERLITEPPFFFPWVARFFIAGMPCFMPRNTPVALIPINRFQAAVS